MLCASKLLASKLPHTSLSRTAATVRALRQAKSTELYVTSNNQVRICLAFNCTGKANGILKSVHPLHLHCFY